MPPCHLLTSTIGIAFVVGSAAALDAQRPPATQFEFFESSVRPLLAHRCHKCHGPDKQESGLRLDHIAHIRKGGERGPAVDASVWQDSRILRAIGYADTGLQMPPKARLQPAEIDTLRRWIEMGAPWPDEPLPRTASRAAPAKKVFDLERRKAAHWAWQPVRDLVPPTIDDPEWRGNPIDRFVLTRLREHGLRPADPADRTTLLRRASFDLIGLPPTVAELDTFLADGNEDAYERVVDRLLASPHFGEHWARHWMDLVRFAETLGHEFDYEIPNAWRYRDYLIRACNADVPYDQLVREHLAGDLLETPRRHPTEGFNESIIGTGFWWFVEQAHSPVDVRKHTADRTHNQIDVMSKTFLGLTVGCARCHDHKFDAISTADYYALSGFLKSSRYMQRDARPDVDHDAMLELHRASRSLAVAWASDLRKATVAPFLRAAAARRMDPQAREPSLEPAMLRRWVAALGDGRIERDALHPMHAVAEFARLQEKGGGDLRAAWRHRTAGRRRERADPSDEFVDFRKHGYTGWFTEGTAFGEGPIRGASMVYGEWFPTAVHTAGWAHSAARGLAAEGVLHSPRFTIDKRFVHVLAHGRESRIKVVLEGFHLVRSPIYGGLKQLVDSVTPRWYTIDLDMWRGKRAYLAFCDQVAPDFADATRSDGYREGGYLAVQRVLLSDSRVVPRPAAGIAGAILPADGAPVRTLDDLAAAYRIAIVRAANAIEAGRATAEQCRLLDWLSEEDLLPAPSRAVRDGRDRVLRATRRIVAAMHVPAMADGTGEDENVFVRGGHNDLGPVTPRRFLTAIAGHRQARLDASGSGRLELAERLLAKSDPFPARVLVNRLWHHVFGRGIVPTVDNFGVQGRPPSHPELLDWLAARFVRDGWSIKKSLRRMVLSRTYRSASRSDAESDARDPELALLHRMPIRRITGESLRDAILQISGRLDRELFGPSVHTYKTRFMTGRGRSRSGPRDGAGRRSIYLRVSRNFLSSFLLAFDFPLPASTTGRRAVTNVPAQALAMLNDPFVQEQAAQWAERIARHHPGPRDRIRVMYREAFARGARPDEERRVLEFLRRQSAAYGCGLRDPRPWRDLCHALWNVKEFVYLR